MHPITIRVTDNGTPALSDAETIQVQVNEANVAPVLADVPASAVMTKAEHVEDEQVMHNAIYRTVPDPTLGMARRPRHPALFGGKPVETDDLPSPALDSGCVAGS